MKGIIRLGVPYAMLFYAMFIFASCSSDGESIIEPDDTNITLPPPVVIPTLNTKGLLGAALFEDTSLSFTRNQSCASCHDPLRAFIDPNNNGVNGAVSLGDDGLALGDRNAPTITYASYIPNFSLESNDTYVGGQFYDGRANDLQEQAKGPFLNGVEMQMPDITSVIERIKENEDYIASMKYLYTDTVFDSNEKAFDAIANAIAEFERLPEFSTFDSKIDQAVMGDGILTQQELEGQRLFVSLDCVSCHNDLDTDISPAMFTNFQYENLGVPKNSEVRSLNAKGETYIDHGLLDNPIIDDVKQDGRFRIPTLRNVAVTGPYMHNGVFKDLKTVIHFYNTRDVPNAINPETQAPWQAAEVEHNMLKDLRIGSLDITDSEEDAIVAFLRALTDERYLYLLP